MTPGERIPLNPTAQVRHAGPIDDPPPLPEPPPVRVAEKTPPTDPEPVPPLALAFRAFQENKPEQAIEHLKGFDPPNQEVLLQLIPAVVQASRANLSRPDAEEAAAVARQFEAAAGAVLRRSGFGIRKAIVCMKVDGYGVYTPTRDPTEPLLPGKLYSVYIELENVPCLPDIRKDGLAGYLTRLEVEMQVADEAGRAVEIVDVKGKTLGPKSVSSKNHFTRSPLRDYHLEARFETPTRPGAYTVTFEVRDPRTGRSVSKPIPFRVQ
jgi:hypothetical protein